MKKILCLGLMVIMAGGVQALTPVASGEESPLIIKGEKPLIDPFAIRIPVRHKVEVEVRPGAMPPGAPAALTQKPKNVIKLEGIWIDATMKVAFISGSALVEGGKVMGWKVAKIYRDRVVLARDGQTKILLLEGIR